MKIWHTWYRFGRQSDFHKNWIRIFQTTTNFPLIGKGLIQVHSRRCIHFITIHPIRPEGKCIFGTDKTDPNSSSQGRSCLSELWLIKHLTTELIDCWNEILAKCDLWINHDAYILLNVQNVPHGISYFCFLSHLAWNPPEHALLMKFKLISALIYIINT